MANSNSKGYRINFTITSEMSQKAIDLAKESNVSLSEFARSALLQWIEIVEQKKLEKELEEGYKANAEYYKCEAKEWENVENDLP